MYGIIEKLNRGIRFSFYALFFLTPLILYPKTFELFEFNKLWFVFVISLVILFLWVSKMIVTGKIIWRRTPFDIPIGLFLLSQIISTIFSLDPHVSFWGYYSRFNGGLFSLTSYIFLYFAFTSNFLGQSEAGSEDDEKSLPTQSISYRILFISLLSGMAVALWGFTSHFGYDLTCLVFRGQLDVSCWTDAFQPTVRMFSTLGQPNWLAAYFSILIPIALALGIYKVTQAVGLDEPIHLLRITSYIKSKKVRRATLFLLLAFFLFAETLWTGSQSGYLGLLSGLVFFTGGILFFVTRKKSSGIVKEYVKPLIGVGIVFALLAFFLGNPIASKLPFTSLAGVTQMLSPKHTVAVKTPSQAAPAEELGGSDSGKIRLVVWRGALELFKQYPLFGTGVETFAYSYYQVKPKEHNLLSEWDYLYNKAHNEYLNYLATTGIFGLGTYMVMIGWFLWYTVSYLRKSKFEDLNPLLVLALTSSYISILVSNFFGFSVVVINMYFFFIPALVLCITAKEKPVKVEKNPPEMQIFKIIGILVLGIVCLYGGFQLLNFWFADQDYSMGYSLNRAQQYVEANKYLENAVKLYPGEDLYKNELSLNLATLGLLLFQQKQKDAASLYVDRAKNMSDLVIQKHPHNVVFYKTRIQTLFELSQIDKKYYHQAIAAIKEARKLAPTDAKIAYNEGLLYGQAGDVKTAITLLNEAIDLRPNYRDPRYALASYLIQEAKQETDPQKKQLLLDQAKATLTYSLQNITDRDPQTHELLNSIK